MATACVGSTMGLRRREVQHEVGKAREAAQRGRIVQIAHQRQRARVAQCSRPCRRRRQCIDPPAPGQQLEYSQADVAAANDQQSWGHVRGTAKCGAVYGPGLSNGAAAFLPCHVPPDHDPARRPHLHHRRRRHPARRRHPPGRGPALRLQGRRLRLLQEQAARRPRHARQPPAQGPERRGGSRRLRADLLRPPRDRLRHRGAHGARRWRVPGAQAAHPRHLDRQAGRRRGRAAPAAGGQPEFPVPRWPVCRVHPARRRPPQLFDGQCAAQPARPDRAAHPPHARRQVHRPCLRRAQGEGHPAHGRPLRQLLPARGLGQAHRSAGQRHRLCADQGHHRASPPHRLDPADGAVLGRPQAGRPLPARLGRPGRRRVAHAELCAGAFRA
mmetsp:Transcript_45586/g.127041  ORF Transcript_45586/g.127041 Transcript_45586/m.127041 type:complete len:385 (+) Transcript_45586:1677-2831(+)